MKILVVADIHAYDQDQPGRAQPSYAQVGGGSSSSPTEKFIKLLQDNQDLVPDVIICPGDLGDRANLAGIQHSWKFLETLSKINSKTLLLATAGNHDLDSYFQASDHDAKGILQELEPEFPLICADASTLSREEIEHYKLYFWTYNFYIVVHEGVRFVVLNSSAFHGYNTGKKNPDGDAGKVMQEHDHGRISSLTLKRIKKALDQNNEKLKNDGTPVKVNVLVCHHHLKKDGHINEDDFSAMKGAQALIDMLSDTSYGRWLVIHGHRHKARLTLESGSTGPFILSAASFSATASEGYDMSPNQAHLIELDTDDSSGLCLYPSGQIKTYTWMKANQEWLHTGGPSGGLPPLTKFGYRGGVDALAKKIDQNLAGTTPRTWNDLTAVIPELGYLTYIDIGELKKALNQNYSIDLILDDDYKQPFQCGRSS